MGEAPTSLVGRVTPAVVRAARVAGQDVDGRSWARPAYEAVVFAGGGCRCIWQAGFWQEAAPALFAAAPPERIIAVSAGAAFACASLTGRTDSVLEEFKQRVRANPRNFYPRAVLRGKRPFPHEEIYTSTIRNHLDSAMFERLKRGPQLEILLSRPPSWLGARSGISAALVAHILDRRARNVHARWGARLGFQPELVSVRSCASEEELIELILHASCVPPVLPLYWRGERIVLDGGLLDNAPASLIDAGRRTLVLLPKRFPPDRLPSVPGRTYAYPSLPFPIFEFDYTNAAAVDEIYDIGRRDGEAFARAHEDRHAFAQRAEAGRVGVSAPPAVRRPRAASRAS